MDLQPAVTPKRASRLRAVAGRRSPIRRATACAGLLVALALLPPAGLRAAEAPPVVVVAAREGTWQPQRWAFGRVSPWREAALTVPFAARVTRVEVDAGAPVRRGQVLARLDAPGLAGLLDRLGDARREDDLARQRVEALGQGLEAKAVTRDTELAARIDLEQAHGRLAVAWRTLDDALLALGQAPDHPAILRRLDHAPAADPARDLGVAVAPFDGLVAARGAAEGQPVAAGAPLFEVEDLGRVYVEVAVAREALADWGAGTAVAEAPDGAHALTPTAPTPRLDPETGLWRLRFRADNPGENLGDGQWVRVRLAGPTRPVLWVPAEAVVGREGRTYCMRQAGDRFEAVEVTVGPAEDGKTPVLSGLRPGDTVATWDAYLLLYRDLNQLMQFQD